MVVRTTSFLKCLFPPCASRARAPPSHSLTPPDPPAFTVPNSALGFVLTVGHVVHGEVLRSPPASPSYLNSRLSGHRCRARSWSPFTPSILANTYWLREWADKIVAQLRVDLSVMHWIASSEKDRVAGTLEKRLWDASEAMQRKYGGCGLMPEGAFLPTCVLYIHTEF